MRNILIAVLMLISSLLIRAENRDDTICSPDKKYCVKIKNIDVASGDSYTYNIVQIFRGEKKIAEDALSQSDKGMARAVYDCKWSPDSKFFVFLTKEVCGHSIWHSPTAVYDVAKNKFFELDSVIGAIVDDHVKFIGLNMLEIQVMGDDGAYGAPLIKRIVLDKVNSTSQP